MQNIKLLIEYDGTRYDGWQRLGKDSGRTTIQGKIEDVLRRMTGEAIEIIGSGRTDAGVHARGQVANFHTDSTMSCREMYHYLNHYLPEDIGIREVCAVPERFHSRLSARAKTYVYRVVEGDMPCVFDRKYGYRYPKALDIQAMNAAAAFLTGCHDFKAFSSVKRTKKSTVRELYSVEVLRHEGQVWMRFHGNGFLYNMVRIMAGTLIEIGTGERRPEDVKNILESRDRQMAGVTAPACGLCLMKVEY